MSFRKVHSVKVQQGDGGPQTSFLNVEVEFGTSDPASVRVRNGMVRAKWFQGDGTFQLFHIRARDVLRIIELA